MQELDWKSRTRLVDEVVEVIRDRIYEGAYPPGAPLRQEQLAAELNVSRTPLREALRMLEREGLVKVAPGRGLRVVSADLPDLLDAYEAREVVDGLAARLCARRGDGVLVERLRASVETQAAALAPWAPRDYTAANVAFHRSLVEGAGNPYVVAQLPLVRMTSQIFTPLKLIDSTRAASAVVEHEAIAAAVAAGDETEAERLARDHIRTTIASLRMRIAAEAAPG
ncbi:MAG TPA: GntR family transcriptional regulator [Gaiellaceae bacterium]|nr:GntR family transcriptional regulator [Gaiellaceae bacterium]